ncbi:ImmA/IrrE family metallo-endopeptidase [Enterocloster lavalensis]|uniref:ImmA/IrrE family metallo-endopeptidase n=1 Tax=Enterocloster lavalensis TaxID=460384 RepID=UPI003F60817F
MSRLTRDIKRIVAYYQRKYKTSNPFQIAEALGIEIQIGDIGSRYGCYMYLKRSKCIWLNENLEPHELEFVMAHELGHAIMHPRQNCYFIKHKTLLLNSKIEKEANKFAAELLISDSDVQEYVVERQYSICALARLWGYHKELIELKLK